MIEARAKVRETAGINLAILKKHKAIVNIQLLVAWVSNPWARAFSAMAI